MKTVIVTGGSRGIGKCIAENLAKEGYNVVLNYNKSVKEAKKTKEELDNTQRENEEQNQIILNHQQFIIYFLFQKWRRRKQ